MFWLGKDKLLLLVYKLFGRTKVIYSKTIIRVNMRKYYAITQNIYLVEILRETDKNVYIHHEHFKGGIPRIKMNDIFGFFNTFEEAKEYLISKEERKIEAITLELSRRQKSIETISKIEEKNVIFAGLDFDATPIKL